MNAFVFFPLEPALVNSAFVVVIVGVDSSSEKIVVKVLQDPGVRCRIDGDASSS